jgi:murein DD-endopeptidase MepM/ murein hydrolase activator NlpD
MTARKKLEIVLIVGAALSLCACTTSPRSAFTWNLRDTHPKPKVVVEYGPRSVKLPPVQRGTLAPVQTAAVPQPKPRKTPGWYTPAPAPMPVAQRNNEPVRAADGQVQFLWPLKGRIVSDYGTSGSGERNDGINIAAASGTPVHASAGGTVSYCGNELKGFGNLVLIRHDNGYITAYAHVGDILVTRQDRVLAGQVIATTGATGDVASPQLHFEIRGSNQRPVDPKALLPRTFVLASNS